MYYPKLTETSQSRLTTDVFRGFNHNLRIDDGEWYDEKNLSSSHYPLFSQRDKRGMAKQLVSPSGMLAKDALMYIDGPTLYYNGLPLTLEGIVFSDEPKTMVSMGAYAVIFPDKVYINTKDLSDYGNLEASYTSADNVTITYSTCRADGTDYNPIVSATAPADPVNGTVWLDTSDTPHVYKQYSSSTSSWVAIATTYVKIQSPNIGSGFEMDDGVTISGVTYSGENTILAEQLGDLNADHIIYDKGDDYLIVVGVLDEVYQQTTGNITVERLCPEMDFVTESGNRIWGCRYGLQNGRVVNEIYACKLGDFKNWRCYAGLSTDSYAVTVGTDGVFTGASTYQGYPTFFKEDCLHKIYGAYPAQYQVSTIMCRGVQQGSERSLCIVNEILYYKSRSDICAFDGSMPNNISEALGSVKYRNAVAGAHAGRYYVSMMDPDEQWGMYTFDTEKGLWHREDDVHVMQFANVRGDLQYIDADTKQLMSVTGMSGELEDDIEWMAESGIQGYEFPDEKYLGRYNIRARLGEGAWLTMYLEYDSDGIWEDMGTWRGNALTGTINIPVIPRRCDHLRLKIEGCGDVKIYSIARMLEGGSDVSWHLR